MKNFLTVLILLATTAYAAGPQTSITPPGQKEDYSEFVTQAGSREHLADCIAKMDQLITDGEHGLVDKEPDQGMVETVTHLGLRIEFSTTNAKEAIVYYLKISRDGKELKYADAAKFIALFADRVGLPHLIEVTEGDKCTFYAQWFFKPSKWKSNHKLMVKFRAENRAETDPLKVFIIAIEREVQARANAQQQR